MTVVAGVDIGNSTTEIVLADIRVRPPVVIATERAPTRGLKGSAESGVAAAALVRRLARREELVVETSFLTPQRPVHTGRYVLPETPLDLGPLTMLAVGAPTPAGEGHGVGRPIDIDTDPARHPADQPVVLVALDPLGYRATVAAIHAWVDAGHRIVGLLLAGDEAALVGARVSLPVPIVDGIDAQVALRCGRIAIEVAPPGSTVRTLADPLWLADAFALPTPEHARARDAAALTRGHRCAAIGRVDKAAPRSSADPGEVTFLDGTAVPIAAALPVLRRLTVPSVASLREPHGPVRPVQDLWLVDLADAARDPGVRAGSVSERAIALSALASGTSAAAAPDAFASAWDGRVVTLVDEPTASRLGALTTPGARPDAWVIDLGGGTVDAIGPGNESVVAAGCGELMTHATAHALAISAGAAEWVKRGPASRVEAPHVVSDETGERRFLDAAAPHGSVGWLVASGPTGSLPFSRSLALAEWRGIRLALKRQVFADNLTRVLRSVSTPPTDIVVTGGPAGDDELLETLNAAIGSAVVGRARVAGSLDHRWAVAYGLVLAGVRE